MEEEDVLRPRALSVDDRSAWELQSLLSSMRHSGDSFGWDPYADSGGDVIVSPEGFHFSPNASAFNTFARPQRIPCVLDTDEFLTQITTWK